MYKVFVHILEREGDGGLQPLVEVLDPAKVKLEFLAEDTEEAFVKGAHDADAIIGAWRGAGRPITRSMIGHLERCRVIALCIVGSDRVDVTAATEGGILVTNVPDVFIPEVADHTLMLILALQRHLPLLDRMARDGRWTSARPFVSRFPRLLGQTLGLVGFGRVARAVAARAKPFGLNVLAHDPYLDELTMIEHGAEPVSLPDLLTRSDIVSMHVPGGSGTTHLIGESQLRLMKRSALLVNTGRGVSVDERALIRALQEEWISGAALDVLEQEPVAPDNPLCKMDSVILTPHVGSASARMEPTRRRRVAEEVMLVLEGRWPRSCINPDVLDRSGLSRWQPVSMERGPAR